MCQTYQWTFSWAFYSLDTFSPIRRYFTHSLSFLSFSCIFLISFFTVIYLNEEIFASYIQVNGLCRSLTVAASNEEEKERWLEDLNMAIAQADADPKMPYLNLKACSKYP